MCTINQDHMMYGSWDIKRKGQSFFVILGHVLTFDPPNNPKNQSFEKKTPGDISILHLCNTNDDHMMYGSWDTERDRQNFFSFWTIFWTFMPLPLTTERIKILKKWKKNKWRYHHFTQAYHKWQSYDIWFLRYGTWRM